MKRYESECVSCTTLGMHCIGDACPKRRVPHFYCDKCKDEFETLYHYDGEELCIDCIEERLEKVE